MTRFARAAGSKSSNQRVPEESTPWFLLKPQQVQDSEQNQSEETNWKSVLDTEKKIEENKNSVWCEFETEKPKVGSTAQEKSNKEINQDRFIKKRKSVENNVSNSNKKKAKVTSKNENDTTLNLDSQNNTTYSEIKHIKTKQKLANCKTSFQVEHFSESKTEFASENNDTVSNFKNERKPLHSFTSEDSSNNSIVPKGNEITSVQKKEYRKNKIHKGKSFDSSDADQSHFTESHPNNWNADSPKSVENDEIRSPKERKWNDSNINDRSTNKFLKNDIKNQTEWNSMKRNNTVTWQKRNKQDKNLPYKRRKFDEGDIKLDINGEEIWVTRLDGFYIKKEDAERIRQLEKDLLNRAVSKQEVRAVVKKERRNAEKSLARQKKKVCYHCRKGGHTLSSCPKLEDNGAQVVGSGICYKCGSTEHTHFQCKVTTGPSYKFATCFVCKQEGHISKQCPDNPRGMYPTGGGCRLCGDVTHFRRECPTLQNKANKITVGLIDQNVETLGDQNDVPKVQDSIKRRPNKIVKFS